MALAIVPLDSGENLCSGVHLAEPKETKARTTKTTKIDFTISLNKYNYLNFIRFEFNLFIFYVIQLVSHEDPQMNKYYRVLICRYIY